MVNEIETSDPMESGENGINWRQLFVDMRLASQQRKAQQESAHAESFVIDILKQVQAENSAPTVQNFLQQGALEILATQDLEDYWWSRLTELTHSRQSEALKVWVADNSTRMTEAQKVQLLSLSQRTSEDEEVAFRETGRGRFHGIEKVFGFPGKHGEQEEDDKEWIKGHEATEAMRQAAELTKEDLVGFWEGASKLSGLPFSMREDLEALTEKMKPKSAKDVEVSAQSLFFDYLRHHEAGVKAVMEQIKGPLMVTTAEGKVVSLKTVQDFLKQVASREEYTGKRKPTLEMKQIEAIQTPLEKAVASMVEEAQKGEFPYDGTTRHHVNINEGELLGVIREGQKDVNAALRWNAVSAQLRKLDPQFDLSAEAAKVFIARGSGYAPQRFVFELNKLKAGTQAPQDRMYLVVDLPNPRGYQDTAMMIYKGELETKNRCCFLTLSWPIIQRIIPKC